MNLWNEYSKIRNGWIFKIDGKEYMIDGSINIRKSQIYLLKNISDDNIASIKRKELIDGLLNGSIQYIQK